jgi:2-(1,2-epoxy-1,2-dihydrophenyl)acetyl-CoA isomerase
MAYEQILYSVEDRVLTLTLNRPDRLNAFTGVMCRELIDAFERADADDAVRAVIVTGAGRGFCAGQDLTERDMNAKDIDLGGGLDARYNPLVKRMRALGKPVVCAVNGIAAGAGANIALACDIVVAVSSASFVQAFSKIGLIPDCGGTFFLPRLIGLQKATALMMLGDKISSAEAERMGMIYACFDEADFVERSHQVASVLAKLPTAALILTRKALLKSSTNKLEEQLELEKKFQQKAGQTEDFKEGVTAFLQKRTPVFSGK